MEYYFKELIHGQIPLALKDSEVVSPLWGKTSIQDFIKDFMMFKKKYHLHFHKRLEVQDLNKMVVEYEIEWKLDRFPFVIVIDFNCQPNVRIYHSSYPFLNESVLTPSYFSQPATLKPLPQPLINYFECLKQGNVEGLVACFSQKGYFQEPSGLNYRYYYDQLTNTFNQLLYHGGVSTLDMNIISDEDTYVLEHDCWSSTHLDVPKQAGIAIYRYNVYHQLTFVHVIDNYHI